MLTPARFADWEPGERLEAQQRPIRHPAQELMFAFAALTARMLHIDYQTLEGLKGELNAPPDLVSLHYLRAFGNTFYASGQRLLKILGQLRTTDHALRFLDELQDHFLACLPHGFNTLNRIANLLLERTTHEPHSTLPRFFGFMAPFALFHFQYSRHPSGALEDESMPSHHRAILVGTRALFVDANKKLQFYLDQQSCALPVDELKCLVAFNSETLLHPAFSDLPRSQDLLPERFVSALPVLAPEVRATLVRGAWCMEAYKRCFVRGRMEARVFGVESMTNHLINFWYEFGTVRDQSPAWNIVVEFLADFIQRNQLPAYLTGVDSHPQLISRCANIINFLCVSKTYTHQDTDVICNAIVNCQDRPAADALKEMFAGVSKHLSFHDILYWFIKLSEFPSVRFDSRILQLCETLLSPLAPNDQALDDERLVVYHLFHRLLRDALAENQWLLPDQNALSDFSVQALQVLSQTLPLSEEDRTKLLSSCARDILAHSQEASGSISALLCLVCHSSNVEIPLWDKLQTEWKIAELVVQDLRHLRYKFHSAPASQWPPRLFDDRLSLICRLILKLPTCFSPELIAETWRILVGEDALAGRWRATAWYQLAQHVKLCEGGRNQFFEQVLSRHFESLLPAHFTAEALAFVDQVDAHLSLAAMSEPASREGQQSWSVGDLYWTLALKAENSSIGSSAIARLVDFQANVKHTATSSVDGDAQPSADFRDRAVETLAVSATKLKQLRESSRSNMASTLVSNDTEHEMQSAQLRLTRSLEILLKFIEFAPQKRQSRQASPQREVSMLAYPGDQLEIKYQGHSGGKSGRIEHLKVGNTATLRQLASLLSELTGFPRLKLHVAGERLNLEARGDVPLMDIPNLTRGLVLVQKAPDVPQDPVQLQSPQRDALETEIMKHFSSLYDLLAYDDSLAQRVLRFLQTFSLPEAIVTQLLEPANLGKESLPTQTRFQTLYSVHALNYLLDQHLREGVSSSNLLIRGIRNLGGAILALQLDPLDPLMASSLTEALLRFLKEPVDSQLSAQYFDNSRIIVKQLATLAGAALVSEEDPSCVSLINAAFACMLEVSLHDDSIWPDLESRQSLSSLLKLLLIQSQQQSVQKAARSTIQSFLGALSSRGSSRLEDYRQLLWHILESNMAEAVAVEPAPESFFGVALDTFRAFEETAISRLPLTTYVTNWGHMLCEHRPLQHLNFRRQDFVASGLASLIQCCFFSMKAAERSSQLSPFTIEQVWRNLLFLNRIDVSEDSKLTARLPVMNSKSRGSIYNMLLTMCNDRSDLRQALFLCKTLVGHGDNSNASHRGLAHPSERTILDENWDVNRISIVRSEVGYAGLDNPSNICYLNSLLAQLFMNTGFRSFILSVRLHDPNSSQRLLWETQKLLALQQDTWLKAVDPSDFANAVITYDDAPIDIRIQMDVDEFYNLLFDRLEGQIIDEDQRKRFRRFYGGHTVQQIKSRDCPHVSEKSESFSAIQCEIQGKSNLAQSLQDLVAGEMMEGDNMYRCGTCGSLVNAVKRACFKDLPDNIMLHLKRFDYDLTTFTRRKINSHFEFPMEIDMSPYKIEHLIDESSPCQPDMFTLVGVLVHIGSAESGHYYSYVRDVSQDPRRWIEFNDSDVRQFDPADIGDSCYGGYESPAWGSPVYEKLKSAYMLFYQRKSSMEDASRQQQATTQPPKAIVPLEIARSIAMENSLFMHRVSTHGSEHARFLKGLLDRLCQFRRTESCTDDHKLESNAIDVALGHVYEVSARQKMPDDALAILDSLCRLPEDCVECAKTIVDWFMTGHERLRDLLLRCKHGTVRHRIASMLVMLVRTLRDLYPSYWEGILSSDSSPDSSRDTAYAEPAVFVQLCSVLSKISDDLPQFTKTWDIFFDVLCELAEVGGEERRALHSRNLLKRSLCYLVIANAPYLARRLPKYQFFARMCEQHEFPMVKLVEFVAMMLRDADNEQSDQLMDDDDSYGSTANLQLTDDELALLFERPLQARNMAPGMSSALPLLLTVFCATRNAVPVCEDFVRVLCSFESLREPIFSTIVATLSSELDDSLPALLGGALVFMETCAHTKEATDLVLRAAHQVDGAPRAYAREFLKFFVRLRVLRAPRDVHGEDSHFYTRQFLASAHVWAPHLLTNPMRDIREGACVLLRTIEADHGQVDGDDEELADAIEQAASRVFKACTKWCAEARRRGLSFPGVRLEQMRAVMTSYLTEFLADDESGEEASDEMQTGRENVLRKICSVGPIREDADELCGRCIRGPGSSRVFEP